jgi:hypothetical protein
VQNSWSSPSGSRWEPVPQPDDVAARSVGSAPGAGPATARRAAASEPRRRYRRPVVAVLLTLLGAGAVTGGAAYAQGDGTLAGAPPAPAGSHVARSGDHGDRDAHGSHGSSS